MMITFAIGT